MASTRRRATYLAPGKIKACFLPGMLSKTPSESTLSKDNQVLNVSLSGNAPSSAINLDKEPINEEHSEDAVNMLHTSLRQSLGEDIDVQENMMQRSINNAALSKFLEETERGAENTSRIEEESDEIHDMLRIHEQESNPLTRKRAMRPDAKSRGVNKCKKVANLKQGEKLEVDYYLGGPVGNNHNELSRHMGKLVRDRTICPVRVHSWDEIDNTAKEHMWQSVLNKFSGKGFELDRRSTINHMKRLWQNWRGILNQNSIINKGGLKNALKETPNDLTSEDWHWLVTKHYSDPKFLKISARNSSNRGNLTMLHHTGSTPFRHIIWEEMGGKQGNDPPPISAVFKRTREGKKGKLNEEDAEKYDEIVDVETNNPSLSHFDVVENCFGPQDRGSVVCFGFGVKPKDVRGPLPSRADLTASLHEKQKENDDLRQRMDELEKSRQEYEIKMKAMDDKLNMLLNNQMQQ